MSQLTEITITNVLPTATAFAVITNNPSVAIFIPGKVADACHLRVGQIVDALLIPNTTRPDKTPFMAAHIVVRDEADTLAALIREDLGRGAATAAEVAASIDKPLDEVARKLRAMSVQGSLVRQDIFALHEDDFMRADEGEE